MSDNQPLVSTDDRERRESGLSDEEVAKRRARGEGNDVRLLTSRSYAEIFRENFFAVANVVLFFLGAVLIVLGRPGDALVSIGVVLVNTLVGVVQEVRAKRTLDRIALLNRPFATVVRGAKERRVDPGEIVRGDLLIARPGDQIVVDGELVDGGPLAVDESLLTGESKLVTKNIGDRLYSGSFSMAGQGFYEARVVGAESLANQLTSEARAFRREYTPLQKQINLIVRVVLLLAFFLELLIVVGAAIEHVPVVETVKMSVVIAGLVPNGLILAVAIAYGAAAVRIAGHGLLVQETNAIESLSGVDVLCLDKTGTLTTGRHQVEELYPIGVALDRLQQSLGDVAANVSAPNRTVAAIARACPGQKRPVLAEAPFYSERRWSGLAFGDPGAGGYVLGAPEVLQPSLTTAASFDMLVPSWSNRGLRVLLLAFSPDLDRVLAAFEQGALPPRLVPIGLVGLSDELRTEARETLDAFVRDGIRLKIISGDNPLTVSTLARQVGVPDSDKVVSGSELAKADPATLAATVESATVFGRIAPRQKRDLIRALRQHGHHVAMIGDGVNDVLALKQANLGIALGSGSPAARAVSDVVLLDDSFASLPIAFREGRRIQSGMGDILKLFLTRVLYFALLLVATGMIGEFPLGPRHNALLTLLTVGIPAVALAAWARPSTTRREQPIWRLFHFVLPAALTLSLAALAVHLYFYLTTYNALLAEGPVVDNARAIQIAQSALTTFGVLCGLMLLVFVGRAGGERGDRGVAGVDRRHLSLALGLLASYLVILTVPSLRRSFDLAALSATDYLLIALLAGVWSLILRWTWHARLLERFLGLEGA